MLTDDSFYSFCCDRNYSNRTRSVIERIRKSPPSRNVRSGKKNVSGRYPSRKMGVTIQFESHKVELAALYLMEHDPQTFEFYDQPPSIKLEYRANNGKNVGVLHTPDFFVLQTEFVGWEEWKHEDELPKLAEKMPNRYVLDAEGQWRCLPGERYAEQYGLRYRVRSSAELDWQFLRNLTFLEDYFRDDCPAVDPAVAEKISRLVNENPGITLDELLRRLSEGSEDT